MPVTAVVSWENAVRSLLERPECADIVRDCYYDQPIETAARRYRDSAEWAAARTLLPAGGKLALDLGAGQGVTSYALACGGYQVTALDPDDSPIVGLGAIRRLAELTGSDIKTLQGSGEHIPCADEAFDLIMARQALHHAADLQQMCRECFRTLRPGGTLLTLRDHVISRDRDLAAFLEAHPLHNLYGGENALRLGQYQAALRDAGFWIERTLGSFDSPVNYAPHTPTTLRDEIARRLECVPGARAIATTTLRSRKVFGILLWLMSRADQRPGRLVSFVCRKPVR